MTDEIEQPHDELHGYVGHHMGSVPTAAFDPIFWLHHCNVDRQWATWQLTHPGANSLPSPDSTPNDISNRPFSELLDVTALGYDYDDLAPVRHAPTPLLARHAAAVPGQRRLILENMRQPDSQSLTLRFFKASHADASTETRGNPDFLGSIWLFGHSPALPGVQPHHHATQRRFRRHLLLRPGVDLTPDQVTIVAVDAQGQALPLEQIAPEPPVLK